MAMTTGAGRCFIETPSCLARAALFFALISPATYLVGALGNVPGLEPVGDAAMWFWRDGIWVLFVCEFAGLGLAVAVLRGKRAEARSARGTKVAVWAMWIALASICFLCVSVVAGIGLNRREELNRRLLSVQACVRMSTDAVPGVELARL